MAVNGVNGSHGAAQRTAEGEADVRPLEVAHPQSNTRLAFPVSAQVEAWTASEILRDSFLRSLDGDDTAATVLGDLSTQKVEYDEDVTEEQAKAAQLAAADDRTLILLSLFLRFVARPAQLEANPRAQVNAHVAQAALAHLVETQLKSRGTDLHARTAKLEPEQRTVVIRAYFDALIALEQAGVKPPAPLVNQLFADDGPAEGVQALFGGQGTNEVYFDELQTDFAFYGPLIEPLLRRASSLLDDLAKKHADSMLFAHGLNAHAWLLNPSSRPPVPYLASCAASLPLIGLTQIAQYIVCGRALGLSPAQMRSRFTGGTGHSQGVVTACVIARDDASDWAGFVETALVGLRLLFYIGLRGSEAFPPQALSPTTVQKCVDANEGVPTPMLSITGLAHDALQKHIDTANGHLESTGAGKVAISLYNGQRAFVVTGPPASLAGLASGLRKVKADDKDREQARTPHSKRKPVFTIRFLPIGVPYHSSYLAACTDRVVNEDLVDDAAFWDRARLSFAVWHTEDGHDLREAKGGDSLLRELCDQIFVKHIHWRDAARFPTLPGGRRTTHAIDFGPGGPNGVISFTQRNLEGRGIRVIVASGGTTGRGAEGFYATRKLVCERPWVDEYGSKLVKAGGKVHIDNRFSRLLGKPPLMVPGMTPSTVGAGFVAAVLNAGYHIELAGGGHYNEKALRAKVADIKSRLETPGLALTLNSLYINQRQWTFQLPLWQQMRQEGLPIEGLCIAAGIPSPDVAQGIIASLRASGIKHVGMKPGSVSGIRQVCQIADQNPDYPILLQWTGGRAGGHHSCEDFHAPILATYAQIRQHRNLFLVGGSGFGSFDDVWPYLSGEWSEAYGVERMPFDGFLFGSWVMVAKEAHTSQSVKELIVAAPGVGDKQWEGTYDKPTGGILTVRSELGEPIHKIATRAIKFWRELDDTVFNLPREKRAAWLADNKAMVISRLNADYNKPWFPAKADGSVCDLEEMTYAETVHRMVRLLYVSHQKRWIDTSLRDLLGDWLRRIEERLSPVTGKRTISELQSYSELETPGPFLERFFAKYREAETQVLASEDVKYFLMINRRAGQKPTPYITVLDEHFELWFKKDSLWAAEDIDAVFDQDPQRVAILQGPVAVRHCKRTDEPIKDMLGNIEKALIAKMLETQYANDESRVPSEAYLASSAPSTIKSAATLAPSYRIDYSTSPSAQKSGATVHSYAIDGILPPTKEWLDGLAGPQAGWLRAFLTNVSFVQGESVIDNPAKRIFAPRSGQRVELTVDDATGSPVGVKVFGAVRDDRVHLVKSATS